MTFAPTDITGCRLWIKADKGVYTDTAMNYAAQKDGAAVAAWEDFSGQGNHLVQVASSSRPIYFTNRVHKKPALSFSGSGMFLQTAVVNTVPSQCPFTVFVVYKSDLAVADANRRIIGCFTHATTIGWELIQDNGTSSLNLVKRSVQNTRGGTVFFDNTKFQIVTVKMDSGFDGTFYLNNQRRQKTFSTLDCNLSNQYFTVGGALIISNLDFDGDIAEVIIYAAELTDSQISQVNDYLSEKYAIALLSALNAASYLTTPTYDGSGEAVHPSIVYNASGWNGYKYWMSYTPYPNSDGSLENPSIVCSNDGNTWIVPAGLTNPIDLPAVDTTNSDSDLCYSIDGTILYCIWREAKPATWDRIYLSSSIDGFTWAAPTLIMDLAFAAAMSPSLIWGGTQWVVYSIKSVANVQTIERRTCATIDGTWSAPSAVTVTNRGYNQYWHLDIIMVGAEYKMLLMDGAYNDLFGGLNILNSADGLTFTSDVYSYLSPSTTGAWDSTKIYRGTFLWDGTQYLIWYSAYKQNGSQAWHVGRVNYTPPQQETYSAIAHSMRPYLIHFPYQTHTLTRRRPSRRLSP